MAELVQETTVPPLLRKVSTLVARRFRTFRREMLRLELGPVSIPLPVRQLFYAALFSLGIIATNLSFNLGDEPPALVDLDPSAFSSPQRMGLPFQGDAPTAAAALPLLQQWSDADATLPATVDGSAVQPCLPAWLIELGEDEERACRSNATVPLPDSLPHGSLPTRASAPGGYVATLHFLEAAPAIDCSAVPAACWTTCVAYASCPEAADGVDCDSAPAICSGECAQYAGCTNPPPVAQWRYTIRPNSSNVLALPSIVGYVNSAIFANAMGTTTRTIRPRFRGLPTPASTSAHQNLVDAMMDVLMAQIKSVACFCWRGPARARARERSPRGQTAPFRQQLVGSTRGSSTASTLQHIQALHCACLPLPNADDHHADAGALHVGRYVGARRRGGPQEAAQAAAGSDGRQHH